MSGNNSGSKLAIFLAGLGAGAAIALLFAPRSGEETRELLSKRAERGRNYLEARGREFQKQTRGVAEKAARDIIGVGKDLVAKATN
ncbi:MAG TPA: YtxH domain-containing protein [Terriglobia bacterium]|nr:YtxH domain-containing protein [Terriglobia bacterium]